MKKNIGKRILSLALALVMVVGLLPMTALTAYAAPSEAETIPTSNTGKHAYSENLTVYYKHNNYLYKVVFSNIKDLDTVGLCFASSTSSTLLLAGNRGMYLAPTPEVTTRVDISNFPTQTGSSVNFYLRYNAVNAVNQRNPVVTVTCMGAGDPTWSWNGTSAATAVFTSTDGNATITVGATITSSTQRATSCLDNDKTTYTATATCNGQTYTDTKTVDGAAGPHSYTYTADDFVLTETCTNSCGHQAIASIVAGEALYTGSEITNAATIFYDSGTWGGDEPVLSFENNVNVGTATVKMTAGDATASTTFKINPASLSDATVTLDPASGTYTGSYHGMPNYTLTYNGKELVKNTDYIVDADWSGNFTNVGSCNLTLKGNGNFTGYNTLTYAIHKATPDKDDFSIELPQNTIYDDETAYFATVSVKDSVNGMGDVTVKYNGSTTPPTDAGTYTVTVDVAAGDNYNAATIELGSFTIAKAEGNASVSVADWTYGDAPNAPVVSSTNGTDNVTYQYKVKGADDSTYTDTVPTQAGDYTVKASFAATQNYTVATATDDFTLSRRPITVTAEDASATYGDGAPLTWTVTSGNKVGSDWLDINIIRESGEDVGTYTITVGQDEGANPNYDITFVNGTFTIHKASLTVVVHDQEIVYGDEIGEIIAGFDGFLDTTHFATQLDFSNEVRTSTYKQYDNVGTYPITISGITSRNYAITYVPGTLTVLPKPITVTIADKTSRYGEKIAELTATDDGIVNNDENVYSLATTATSTANAGTYPITGTTLDNNYAITFVNGTYTITKAPVNSTGTDMAVDYTAGMEVDLRQMFSVDENAGEVDYWITHLTGEGSFTSAPYLYRIDKAGTFTVKITTKETENYKSGEAKAVLTVNPGDPGIGAVTAGVVNDTLETSAIVLTRENTDVNGNLTVEAGQTLAWGDNTIRYTFTPNDTTNYKVVKGEVTVSVVDTIAPVGTVSIDDNKWNDLWNTITFGLFFKETKTVKVAAEDVLSGIAKVEYYDSATALSADAVKAITAWNDMGADYAQDVTAEDAKTFIYYIRITDKAGNVTYISTADATYDLTKPAISGITNGGTYYTTQKVTVTDKNIDTITLNGEAATDAITLEGNKEATYTIVATDKAGNSTTVTVTMKPIKELAKATENLGNDNVTSADAPALEELVAKLDELIADPDTSDDGERETLEQHKVIAEALLKTIEDVAKATDTENTAKVEDVTADNVTPEDKSNLEDAKADLEDALENNGGNYTEEEKKAIKDEIQRIDDAMVALENVEDVTDSITQLPETVEPDDEETAKKILDAKEAYDELTDHEKSLVDDDTKKKLDDLTAAAVAYKIVKGDNGMWTKGSTSGLSFTANGAYSKFTGILVDNKVVDSKHYTAESGSTVITLKASYLDTLSTGKHTLTVVYTDGETSCEFNIAAKSTTPATGDNFNILLWTSGMIVSLAAIAVLLIEQKKRRYVK